MAGWGPGLVYQCWEILGGLGFRLCVGTREAGRLEVPWLALKSPLRPMSSLTGCPCSILVVCCQVCPQDNPRTAIGPLAGEVKGEEAPLPIPLVMGHCSICFQNIQRSEVMAADQSVEWVLTPACGPDKFPRLRKGGLRVHASPGQADEVAPGSEEGGQTDGDRKRNGWRRKL